ncbi:MAG: hypothetical protein KDA24_18635 [Deltaproteobacteria bacterium]|nr:hypothetical protein [Deltaproteobacteria bacterium]
MENTPIPLVPPADAGFPSDLRRGAKVGFFHWNRLVSDGPATPPPRPLVVGPYELMGVLGEGGAARVYLARRRAQPAHLVALKVFAEEFAIDPTERSILSASVKAVERLGNPTFLDTYEVGEADGRLYLAMERVYGWNLKQLRAACPFGLPDRVLSAVRRQLVRGLHPGNVMVSVDGRVRVLDLPSARTFGRNKRCGGPRGGKRDTALVRAWIAQLEPRLPALPGAGDWGDEDDRDDEASTHPTLV